MTATHWRGASRPSAAPLANAAEYAHVRLLSSHESPGVSDQGIDSVGDAGSSANAASLARAHAGGGAPRGIATPHTAAPTSSRPTSVHVVRSTFEPPVATNVQRRTISASPAISAGRTAGSGIATPRSTRSTPRRCGRYDLRLASEDTLAHG